MNPALLLIPVLAFWAYSQSKSKAEEVDETDEPDEPEELAPAESPQPAPRARPRPAPLAKPRPDPSLENIAKAAARRAMGPPANVRKLAAAAAKTIAANGRSYDRDALRRFQKAAGIVVDGLYGGGSAGAIRHFLGKAPKPLFKPLKERVYKPNV